MDIKTILETCYHLDTMRLDLYDQLNEESKNIIIPNNLPTVNNSFIEWNGKSLKITIPELLHSNKLIKKDLDKKIEKFWISAIYTAYKKLNIDISLQCAYCWIIMYASFHQPWDVDNRCYKYIVDGIRMTRIIKDDSREHLIFGIAGMLEENEPRTEIYITEINDIKRDILSYFGGF